MSGLEHGFLLAAVIILGPLYFFVWWEYKDLQKKMLRLSLFGAPIGPIAEWWYSGDYLKDTFSLGVYGFFLDLIVAFLLIGITSVTVNVMRNKRSVNNPDVKGKRSRYLLAFVLIFGVLLVFSEFLGFLSLLASALGFLTILILIWKDRKDLIGPSLTGGVSMLGFGIVCYVALLVLWPAFVETGDWDTVAALPNLALPLKEFFWLFTWGMLGSVLYEWRHGYVFSPRHA
jgi:hypothetical protein